MNTIKNGLNNNIEALRGFAALCVFFFHIKIDSEFNLNLGFKENPLPYSPPGHLMVMVFFVLSGYVIGLTNKVESEFNLLAYLKKRLLRLYPIYLFSILITVILFKENLDSIIGNIFFIQNLFVDNLIYNHSLWSINHEIIYYLLAVPILFFKIKPQIILFAIAPILSFSLWYYPYPAYLEAYLVGFSFWIFGMWLSRFPVTSQVNPNEILATFLLILSSEYLNLFNVIISKIPVFHNPGVYLQSIINFKDIGSLPVCIFTLLTFTGVNEKFRKYFFLLVYSSSFVHLAYLLISGSFFKTEIFLIPSFLLVSALITHYLKSIRINLDFLVWTGSISYGLYVIHAPVMYSFKYIPFLGQNRGLFILRVIVIISIVLGMSYVLEKKMQPFFRKKLS